MHGLRAAAATAATPASARILAARDSHGEKKRPIRALARFAICRSGREPSSAVRHRRPIRVGVIRAGETGRGR